MKKEKQLELYKALDSELIDLTVSKSHDYADEDVLSNFKSVAKAAEVLNINPQEFRQYPLFMVILKLARLGNLLKDNKNPNNESIEDTYKDGINYFKLAYTCFKEEQDLNQEFNLQEVIIDVADNAD